MVNYAFKKLAVPLLEERERLPFVSSVFEFLFDKLQAGVVFIENFTPRLDANGDVGAAIDEPQQRINTSSP